MDQMTLRQLSDQATVRLLNKPGTVSSSRGGWMMIATILIEAWDLYAISFLLIFIKDEYNPSAAQLGLATAAVQAVRSSARCSAGWWPTGSDASGCSS